MNPQYPVYIVSKGRHNSRFTSKTLEKLGVPYRIVVEEQERDAYAAVIDPAKVLVLDPAFQRDYDTFDLLGDEKSKGPGPARNFAWEHARAEGHRWHWVMDDNIRYFYRLDQNIYGEVLDGTVLRCMEDFSDRYSNVAMSGPNYFMWAPRKNKMPPFVLNTRIYSCNLIRNDIPYRWRGRYNEDTDLSLRVLKDGWCTVQFNAFLQHKEVTQRVAGGNTEAFYAKEGTLPKSSMLVAMHPDVAKLTKFDKRFNRWHHMVDYSPFRTNVLVRRSGVEPARGVDEYGMHQIPAVRRTNGVPYTRKAAGVAPGFRYALPEGFDIPASFEWVLKKDLETNPFDMVVIRRGDRVMDCGAAVGTFSASALEAGAGTVRAYEPVNHEVLIRNLARYGSRAEVFVAALVPDDRESAELFGSGFPGTHSLVGARKGKAATVAALRFRSELRAFLPHMVKMDIEGAEYDLLETLQPGDLAGVNCIFLEFHPIAGAAQDLRAGKIIEYFLKEGLQIKKDGGRAFTLTRPAG
jgi:FkbM family methyltransferase